jgi:hypothetical protein
MPAKNQGFKSSENAKPSAFATPDGKGPAVSIVFLKAI